MAVKTLETVAQNHVATFELTNGIEGGRDATREIVGSIWADVPHTLEGVSLGNQMIFSGEAKPTAGMPTAQKGSVNAQSFSSNGDTAGSYRAAVARRTDTLKNRQKVTKIGGGTIEHMSADPIVLNIDYYLQTANKGLDAPTDDKMSYSNIWNTIVSTMQNDVINKMNYQVYEQFAPAAIDYIDPIEGIHPYVIGDLDSKTAKEYSDIVIEATSRYFAMPNDPYVTGFANKHDIVLISDYKGTVKLQQDKLQKFDGSTFGNTSVWYQGLPYEGAFNGVLYTTSQYINGPNQNPVDYKYFIITTIGRFAPLLYKLQYLKFFTEIAPGEGEYAYTYGIVLYGLDIAKVFSQYITVGMASAIDPNYTTNIVKGQVYKDVNDANKVKFTFNFKTKDAEVTQLLYKVFSPEDTKEADVATWSSIDVSTLAINTQASTVLTGIALNKEYTIVYGPAAAGATTPNVTGTNGSTYKTKIHFRIKG